MARRKLRRVIKLRERMLRSRALYKGWRPFRRKSEFPHVVEILPGWTNQDNDAARDHGWYVYRRDSQSLWVIQFHTEQGRKAYERGLRESRRLACRALMVIAIAALEGK